jgi:hypothetical protein
MTLAPRKRDSSAMRFPGRFGTWLCAVLGLVLGGGGCQKAGPVRTAVQPSKGSLTVDDKPAYQARVFFHPKAEIDGTKIQPMAIVAADGTFQPTTYAEGDGLPVGEYTVTVTWPEIKMDIGEEVQGPDRLHRVYDKPERPVAQVVIQEGPNEIPPIRLKLR